MKPILIVVALFFAGCCNYTESFIDYSGIKVGDIVQVADTSSELYGNIYEVQSPVLENHHTGDRWIMVSVPGKPNGQRGILIDGLKIIKTKGK